MVWNSAADIPLRWTQALLEGARGTLIRTYTLAAYLQEGDRYTVVTDASPLGLGAFLVLNNNIEQYVFGPSTEMDEEVLKVKPGGSEGQQIWESLTILAALRLWSPIWRDRRITLGGQVRFGVRLHAREDEGGWHRRWSDLPGIGAGYR